MAENTPLEKTVSWKDKPRIFPELTPELRKINELIAYGMNGRDIQKLFKLPGRSWVDKFRKTYKIPFVYYKKEILRRLKEGIYE